MPAPCARNSARPRRRCSSPRASSTRRSRSAEERFKGEEPGFIYSRFSNPTVRCSSSAWPRSKAREAARATATGMAAVTAALMGQLQGRRSRGGREGAVRLVPLRRRGSPAALRRRLDPGRRHRSRRLAQRGAAEHQDLLPREPDQSDAGGDRHRGGGEDRPCRRRDARRRQRLRHAALAAARSRSAPTASSIRRPSISTARAAASAASSWRRRSSSRTTSRC